MFDRIAWCTLMLSAVVTLSLLTPAEAAKGKSPKPAGKAEGTLDGVAANGVIIRTKSGSLVSLGVNASTKVELNGVKVPVTSLPVGSRTQALYDPATMIATKVESTN